MKNVFFIILGIFTLFSCKHSEKNLKNQGIDYWGESRAGDTTTIKTEWSVYFEGKDTMTYITNYYRNGQLKSKVTLKSGGVLNIEFVLDTFGNQIPFGHFKNGTGCVKRFDSDLGYPIEQGCYKNGNREGWWKNYHYTGVITDSTFYKNGFYQVNKSGNALGELMDILGENKNNYYD